MSRFTAVSVLGVFSSAALLGFAHLMGVRWNTPLVPTDPAHVSQTVGWVLGVLSVVGLVVALVTELIERRARPVRGRRTLAAPTARRARGLAPHEELVADALEQAKREALQRIDHPTARRNKPEAKRK